MSLISLNKVPSDKTILTLSPLFTALTDSMALPSPFMVLATQNPVETYGTYHLPEAQMDRFMMKISMGYPSPEEELDDDSSGFDDSPTEEDEGIIETLEDEKHKTERKEMISTPFSSKDNEKLNENDIYEPKLNIFCKSN